MFIHNSTKSKQALYAVIALLLISILLLAGCNPQPKAPSQLASYIVQGTSMKLVTSVVAKYGGVITAQLELINGVAADLPVTSVDSIRKEAGITAVTPNASVKSTGGGNNNNNNNNNKNKNKNKGKNIKGIPETDFPDVTGADLVWQQGDVGRGVAVAIVDTGLGWHPGLFQDIKGKESGRIVGWRDFVDKSLIPFDPNGHGTHIAGIIANTQEGPDKEWDGVAPGVNLVGVRVLNNEGYGTYAQVIQGIQWVLTNKNRFNIRVMNLSLISTVQSPYWADPLNQAVMQAWAQGITVVVAAGNGGPQPMTIGVPGNTPYVITVGAFTDNYTPNNWNDDALTPFSSAGPTLDGFAKPDVVAPGAHIVSTMLPWTYIAMNHEANWVTPTYFSMAGTSQAAAVVSGIAALVLSAHPELTPDQVKYRIQYTAFPWVDTNTTEAGYSIWQQGAGRVNALDAVTADVRGSANAGMDIQADLNGTQHYEGYSYYDDATGKFRLRGDFSNWDGRYWAWDGGFGAWSGGFGAWSGGFGAWSGGFGAWSGGFGAWSGGFGAWSGGFGAWSGGFGAWSGGFGAWSGGFGAWSGSVPWANTVYAKPTFVQNFLAGQGVNQATAKAAIGNWVEEP